MSHQNIAASPLQSVIAGATAGGVESFITYPTEYLKTRKQLMAGGASLSPIRLLVQSVKAEGPLVVYTGAGPFCTALSLTYGTRFLTFDTVRGMLPRDPKTGKSSTGMNMLSGITAGIVEALAIVTPGENLKTRIIDARSGGREYRGAFHVLKSILGTEGVSGLFRGALPVVLKQGSNGLVRFTTFNAAIDVMQPWMDKRGWGGSAPAAAGATAGVVDVYLTMPFDYLKTQMQSLGGQSRYNSTWHCFKYTFQNYGVRAFWEGTTPRLVRMALAGAISFSVYSHVVQFLQRKDKPQEKLAML